MPPASKPEITIIGCGTPTPLPDRFGSSYVIEIGGEKLLFDCGPATTWKLAKANISPTEIDNVFFTHHHFDHDADFPTFILTRWDQNVPVDRPLHVYGPPLTEKFTNGIIDEDTGLFAHDWLARVHHPASQITFQDRGGQLPRHKPHAELQDFGSIHKDVNAPVFQFTGWWDRLIGTIDNFTGIVENGPAHLRDSHRLVIGPWGHDATQLSRKIGPIDYGPDADTTYEDLITRWYDYHFKGLDNGIANDPPVRLFVLGENRWRGEQEWPLARTRYTDFFLHSNGHANTAWGDGSLSTTAPSDEPPDEYDYDPRDPLMSLMRADSQAAPVDQSPHDGRQDALVYQTPPLSRTSRSQARSRSACGPSRTLPTPTGRRSWPWSMKTGSP